MELSNGNLFSQIYLRLFFTKKEQKLDKKSRIEKSNFKRIKLNISLCKRSRMCVSLSALLGGFLGNFDPLAITYYNKKISQIRICNVDIQNKQKT